MNKEETGERGPTKRKTGKRQSTKRKTGKLRPTKRRRRDDQREVSARIRNIAHGADSGNTTVLSNRHPFNASTGNYYWGNNEYVLRYAAVLLDIRQPAWVTFHQAKTLGGKVGKGCRGVAVRVFVPHANQDDSRSLHSGADNPNETYGEYGDWKSFHVFPLERCSEIRQERVKRPHRVPREIRSLLCICADILAGGPPLDPLALPNDENVQSLLWPAYCTPALRSVEERVLAHLSLERMRGSGDGEEDVVDATTAAGGGSVPLRGKHHFACATAYFNHFFMRAAELLSPDPRVRHWIHFILCEEAEIAFSERMLDFDELKCTSASREALPKAYKLLSFLQQQQPNREE
jgi:hypothetical protein